MAPVGARLGAGGFAAAQVALLHLARVLHVVHGADGHAIDRPFSRPTRSPHDLRAVPPASTLIASTGQACRQQPLRTGWRFRAPAPGWWRSKTKMRDLAGLKPEVLVRARHLALACPGAIRRVDMKRFLHEPLLLVIGHRTTVRPAGLWTALVGMRGTQSRLRRAHGAPALNMHRSSCPRNAKVGAPARGRGGGMSGAARPYASTIAATTRRPSASRML